MRTEQPAMICPGENPACLTKAYKVLYWFYPGTMSYFGAFSILTKKVLYIVRYKRFHHSEAHIKGVRAIDYLDMWPDLPLDILGCNTEMINDFSMDAVCF